LAEAEMFPLHVFTLPVKHLPEEHRLLVHPSGAAHVSLYAAFALQYPATRTRYFQHLAALQTREIKRESYARRSCVDLKHGVMSRALWCLTNNSNM
jgi:hypothetical protein